jgi:hypothetical protein
MPPFTPQLKQHLLQQHRSNPRECSFAELARRYAVKGGHETVRQWWLRWDGSVASLARKAGTGRARILSRAEVSRHVRAPILAANRAHRAVSYTQLLPQVQAKTGTQLSIRTLRRYGREDCGAKQKRCKKRTAAESECAAACQSGEALLLAELAS